ncbi:MAG: nitronate monooxygenase [Pseudomonadota bacterium]
MTQHLRTPFTERFGLRHPIALAPMDIVSGGRLAGAVSAAGGLGLVGGGYGDAAWLDSAFRDAGNEHVGLGFITWSALERPGVVEHALARRPRALMVSFGDAEPLVDAARTAGVPVLWQVQRLAQARQAIAAGADVVVVQGQEAGGHGMDRGLVSLLPAVRDIAPEGQIILAAGGIADGRGLAAALMLGADGVLMGTRFWASDEATGPDPRGVAAAKAAMTRLGGDDTVRSRVFDVARGAAWPRAYTGRVVANAFLTRWHDRIDALKADPGPERARYAESAPDDLDTRVLIAGEALDLIHRIEPAGRIVETTAAEAAARLRRGTTLLA